MLCHDSPDRLRIDNNCETLEQVLLKLSHADAEMDAEDENAGAPLVSRGPVQNSLLSFFLDSRATPDISQIKIIEIRRGRRSLSPNLCE